MQVIMHRFEILNNSHYTDSANNLISATVEFRLTFAFKND